jgi:hypothetical protein
MPEIVAKCGPAMNIMRMFSLVIVLCLMVIENAEAQEKKAGISWKKIKTVEAICKVHPKRVAALFEKLDFDRPGLEEVKQSVEKKNLPAACNALLAYYKNGNTADWLRKPTPKRGTKKDQRADSLLDDTFTIQSVTARQPRRKDGGLNWAHLGPRRDKEWGWLLNRHGHFNVLLRAFQETGNPIYANCFDEHIRDWVSSNPYEGKRAQSPQWRVLEAALRLGYSWPQAFYGFQSRKEFTPAGRLLMLSSIPEHVDYCRRFHASRGNQVLMEMYGMANAAVCWPEFKEASSWLDYAVKRMTAEITKQVYPDGVQMELTSHYHRVSLRNFQNVADAAGRAKRDLPPEYHKGLVRMWNYLAYSMRPDGHGVLNNDSDLDFNRQRVLNAAKRYNRNDWIYIATNGKEGEKPEGPASSMFPWAGQLVMRRSWDADAHWAFFDAGPWGLAHQHSDMLHVSVSAYGRDLLVDSGRFAYRGKVASEFRNRYARHSRGHNVILIDDCGQAPGPRQSSRPLAESQCMIRESFDFARNSFDKFGGVKGTIRHTRAVLYARGMFWVVVDRIETDRPRKLEALWHWHPHCTVKEREGRVESVDQNQGNLCIVPVATISWKVNVVKGQKKPFVQGWYSKKYNNVEPSPTAVFSTRIDSSTMFAWILFPAKGRAPQINATIVSQNDEIMVIRITDSRDDAFEIHVPVGGKGNPSIRHSEKKSERANH